MKVVKFGGTSLANAKQIKKVCDIILSDKDRRMVVISAPGKRFKEDIKVTDLLIALANKSLTSQNTDEELNEVIERFSEIVRDLDLDKSVIDSITDNIKERLNLDTSDPFRFIDSLKAAGEDNCARLVAAYLKKMGVDAEYVNPKDAGLLLSKEYGKAEVLSQSYDNLKKLKDRTSITIFPGFFGYTTDGDVVTFSRGGSDITGSILAAAVDADLYENFTDVDSIYAVNPNIIPNPVSITVLTFREMRELSYAGFSVFHGEALQPVYRKGIPVAVKNTNNPAAPGTTIVPSVGKINRPVVGIAGDSGFCSIYISKYLMNREIGFGRKLLEIIENEGLSYEHTPSGIDDISVILREDQLDEKKEKRLIEHIKSTLTVDDVSIFHNLALVMVVGEGARRTIGIAARATRALARASVNIEMINQGSSEVSIMFGINARDLSNAIKTLYQEFFENKDTSI